MEALGQLSSELPSSDDSFFETEATLSRVDERLAIATSFEEIALWTRVRGEIIAQNQSLKDSNHRRSLEKFQAIYKTSLSGIAIAMGIGLAIAGLTVPSLVILGAAFYELAPTYLKNIFLTNSSARAGARSFQVGFLLCCITGILLSIASKNEIVSAITQGLMLIVGMTTIAALSAFEQYRNSHNKSASSDLYFDEAFVSNSIAEGIEQIKSRSTETGTTELVEISAIDRPLPWDLSLTQLAGKDNLLALAKLKIEIETEIRRIAYLNNIDINTRPLEVLSLAKELVLKDILPANWLEALEEIILVCNRSIRDLETLPENIVSAIALGGQLLEQLRLFAAQKTKRRKDRKEKLFEFYQAVKKADKEILEALKNRDPESELFGDG